MYYNKMMKRIIITGLFAGLLTTSAYAASADTKVTLDEYKAELQRYSEMMEHAHLMAESARVLGYSEESDLIKEAQRFWQIGRKGYDDTLPIANEWQATYDREVAEEEAARKAAEEARVAYMESQRGSYNVFAKTGLSVDQFNKLLEPYALAGNGQALYDMEQTYGINGIFCLAVARVESSVGGYGPSRNKHNYWGIVGKTWGSDYAAFQGFGNYILNSGYYNGKSIDAIAKIYCPPTASEWASNVKSCMAQFWAQV